MAQESSNKFDVDQTRHESSQLRQTFSRLSAMEQKFQSLKNLYVQNLQSLADKIKDAQKLTASDQKHNPTSIPQTQQNPQQLFDNVPSLKRKIKKLAKLIQKSKHFVAFTGSGISAFTPNTEIRSEPNVLGAWNDKWTKNPLIKNEKHFESETDNTSRSIPTISHMILTGLMTQEPKHLKYVISENKDTFHRQSGISMDRLSELYSNQSDFANKRQHKVVTEHAFEEVEKADLFLVLGSSLTTYPAHDMAQIVGIKWNDEINNEMDREPTHNLVIINTMKTELDHLCGLRIFAKIDDVMTALMDELKLDIPHWNVQRFVRIKVDDMENTSDARKLTVCGVDVDGSTLSIFKTVQIRHNGRNIRKVGGDRRLSIENLFGKRGRSIRRKSDVFVYYIPRLYIIDNDLKYLYNHADNKTEDEEDTGLVMELTFNEQYKEPNLVIEMNEYMSHLSNKNGSIVLKMLFDAMEREWILGNKREQLDDENVRKLWVNYDDEEEKNKPLPNPYELHN